MIDRPWPVPPVFAWLARAGKVAEDELLRVFNCGIGMVLAVSDSAGCPRPLLAELGETAYPIGRVEAGEGAAAYASTCRPAGPGERARLQTGGS